MKISEDDVLATVADAVSTQLRDLFSNPHVDVTTIHISQVDAIVGEVLASLKQSLTLR